MSSDWRPRFWCSLGYMCLWGQGTGLCIRGGLVLLLWMQGQNERDFVIYAGIAKREDLGIWGTFCRKPFTVPDREDHFFFFLIDLVQVRAS